MAAPREVHPPPDVSPQLTMLQMISGFWLSRAIYVAVKLAIPDLVKEQPKSADELALATNTHAPSLYRVLRALASVGIFAEDEQRRFQSTPLAATLQTDIPGSLRFMAMAELGEVHYPAWEHVLYSVKTGEIAFNYKFGMPVWEFLANHPENAQIFDNAMAHVTESINDAILSSYDFSPFRKPVDVGGGHGGLIMGILKANKGMQAVLFDLPHVIESAKSRIEQAGLADRCELIAGDFFQFLPEGGDVYILKWILHEWNDERAVVILKNCRRKMADGGRLLVIESAIAPGNEPSFGKFMDLNMLVMTGGRERTESQYRDLMKAGGFNLTRVVPTPSPFWVIEGVPAIGKGDSPKAL